MKFIHTPQETEREIGRMLRKCIRLRWAVAWASFDFPLFRLLKEHRSKIDQLTVGIHFYQTHPNFIETFLDQDVVRYVMNPSGVFHPKLYFFDYLNGEWECFAGSHNFTRSAFSCNTEVGVVFGSYDSDAASTYIEVNTALDQFFRVSKRLRALDLTNYRALWKRQQRRLSSLSGRYSPTDKGSNPDATPLDVPLFVADWNEYFNSVRQDVNHTIEGRLAVLEEAQRLFSSHERFGDLSDDARKGIAGIVRTEQFDWLWFGSMKGAGYYKKAIIDNNAGISSALAAIPLYSAVSRDEFDAYVDLFRGAFRNAGIATATRLLAMKRPDYFVCFDSKNRKRLCDTFNISRNVEMDNYWERVIERIMDSNWWNSPEPSNSLEKRIWMCRAAFLDVCFYEPD